MASKANLVMDQGSNFNVTITLTDENGNSIDLSGFTGYGAMRKTYSSINTTAFGVSLNNLSGTITLTLDSQNTASVTAGRYVYDIDVISASNVVSRILEGMVTVTPSVIKFANNQTYYSLLVANTQGEFYDGDIVYQSNGSANVSGTVYRSNALVTEIANTFVLKVANTTGAFIVSSNTNYKLYSANTVTNNSVNGTILSVTTQVAP